MVVYEIIFASFKLDEAFGINLHHHPPMAIIVHYKVQIIEMKLHYYNAKTELVHSVLPNSGIHDVLTSDRDDFNVREGEENNCTISMGLSSASVYTFIRPEFILSLQPAWFLSSLRFSIHEHFGFPREVRLYINLLKESLPVNITIDELIHPLEQVTAKVP